MSKRSELEAAGNERVHEPVSRHPAVSLERTIPRYFIITALGSRWWSMAADNDVDLWGT